MLRPVWQFLFYLETDLYYVIATAVNSSNLQAAARFHIVTHFRVLLRRPAPAAHPDWSDRDLAAARWYAPLLAVGYVFSFASLIWVGIPTFARLWSAATQELLRPESTPVDIVDALILLVLLSGELGLLVYVTVRDWRARRRTNSRQGVTS